MVYGWPVSHPSIGGRYATGEVRSGDLKRVIAFAPALPERDQRGVSRGSGVTTP